MKNVTTGIVADNYKLEKFKKEFTAKGITEYEISSFTKDTSIIKITIPEDKVNEIKKICQFIELHFKRSN